MKKVLLIDDEISLLQVYKVLLNKYGYEVDTASTIDNAFLLFSNEYNYLFIDYYMHNENTLKLIEKAVEIYGENKICIVTGLEDEKVYKKIMKLGVKKLLKKPLLTTDFIQIIDTEK